MQDKNKEIKSAVNVSKPGRPLNVKDMQKMNYLLAIYTAEVLAGQDVYCPETRREFSLEN